MVVYDVEYPEDMGKTNITINVDRNPGVPSFNPSVYTKTINESYPLGISLLQLVASDPDNVSIVNSVVCALSENNSNYMTK